MILTNQIEQLLRIATGDKYLRVKVATVLFAPDDKYLTVKVATVLDIFDACRREELYHLTFQTIEDLELNSVTTLLVKSADAKTEVLRSSFMVAQFYLNLYRKYIAF